MTESKLTRGLRDVHYLEYELVERVIDATTEECHLQDDGTLEVPEQSGVVALEEHLGPNVMQLPSDLRDRLRERYGDAMTERDINLVVSGASLAIAAVHGWSKLSDTAAYRSDRHAL